MQRKKVCIIGASAVGKTSLVSFYSGKAFDSQYHSTLGARISTAAVSVRERLRELVIWDIKGETEFYHVPSSYFHGCEGCVLVADGTRPNTAGQALDMLSNLELITGEIPCVMLINKLDLHDRWEFDEVQLSFLREQIADVYTCSARGGITMQNAMETLARKMWGAK